MSTKVAINGFGRIGRCVVRSMVERKVTDIQVALINDLTDAKTLAHLYNYDTVHGRAEHKARVVDGGLEIAGMHIKVTAEKDPANLALKEIPIVMEC
ncbi:MAG TPA: glyceraldehyde 3-phosphate dehydrogenase NAD-binding domain-containing protein, partial [Polyangiaceae bacterium]